METPIKFDPTIAELQAIVEETSRVDGSNIVIVHDIRLRLRDTRIRIEKMGKEKRAEALKWQKDVIAYEKELIAVIEPEEQRLKAIEEEANAAKERESRLAVLPMRREQLEKTGFVVSDEFLLDMDNDAFMVFLNDRIAWKNEADRLAIEQEKAKLAHEAELRKAADEAVEKERDRQELLRAQEENARIYKLAEEKFAAEKAAKKVIDDAREEAERIIAHQKAQVMIEAERKINEENARLEEEKKRVQQAAYQAWLEEIGYVEEHASGWKFETVCNVTFAYRLIGSLRNEL